MGYYIRTSRGVTDELWLCRGSIWVHVYTRDDHPSARTHGRWEVASEVEARAKVVSIFEPHADIIVKNGRDTFYWHKIYLTGGESGLVLDCVIPDGNPADSTLSTEMLQRQEKLYGRPPRQPALDGGFTSKENLRAAKDLGVKDVCFAKKRGLKVPDMVTSTWVYRKLRDFRAGIEGVISFLKRAFGLDRCMWGGEISFRSYAWSGLLAANLLTLARHALA